MSMIKKELEEARYLLDKHINSPHFINSIENAGKLLCTTISNGNKILSCGNGGSMSDAMHFAEELSGKFRNERKALPAIAISDSAHLSCVANDYGFEFVFSRFIDAIGNNGDCLLAISTSGNSENVINAAKTAKEKGFQIIALTGKDGGKLRELADIEIRVDYSGFSDRIQEIHIKVIHLLILFVENNL